MARFRTDHPIWRVMQHQHRTYVWLAGRTGYSYQHVKNVAAGVWPASDDFKLKCSFALDIPADMLFTGETEHAVRRPQPAEVA